MIHMQALKYEWENKQARIHTRPNSGSGIVFLGPAVGWTIAKVSI